MSTKTSENILSKKPLLLDPINSKFPDDILMKINNIICDEYIQKIYIQLEKNFIKNIINMFLNDKKLSKFLYYFGYQTYYFNYISIDNFGVYGETLNNLDWGDFETSVLFEDFKGINIDDREPYILNIPKDEIFASENNNFNNPEFDFHRFDVNIYSSTLTLNETLWIIKNFSSNNDNIFKNNEDIDIDICDDTFENIYDYDKETFAPIWNLFNRGFIKLNILKIIYIYCYNSDYDSIVQQYYELIGGQNSINIKVDSSKLFHKTCFNLMRYFNKKIKKASENRMVISYLYAIYADDDGNGNIYFDERHEEYENKAFDILNDNGLLKTKQDNIYDILDLLYELYLI
jgi:hypothetical protein